MVLSHIAPIAHRPPPAHVQSFEATVPGAPAPGNPAAATAAGSTYEQRITRFNDGTSQVEDRLSVVNPLNGAQTTTSWISLRDHGGLEKVVDVATTVGNTTTHQITTTLPDGSTEAETKTEVNAGDRTTITAAEQLPGGTQTVTGVRVQIGSVQVTDKTTVGPGGTTSYDQSVTVFQASRQVDATTFSLPDGRLQTSSSTTTITRLVPPLT